MKKIILTLIISCGFISLATHGQTASFLDPGMFRPEMIKQLDSIYEYDWLAGVWAVKTKNYKIRNGNGQISEDLYKKINPITSQWSNYLRYTNTYNGLNPIPVTITGQYWTAESSWITWQYSHFVNKRVPDTVWEKTWEQQRQRFSGGNFLSYTFDANQNITSKTTLVWDTVSNDWTKSSMKDYSYNSNNMQVEEIFKIWGDTSWINNFRKSDVYDPANNLISHTEYIWIDSTSTWANIFRVLNTINESGELSYSLSQSWNPATMMWDSASQTQNIYNIEKLLLTSRTRIYDPFSAMWIEDSLKFYTYYQNYQRQSVTENKWNPLTNDWMPLIFFRYDSASQLLVEKYEQYVDNTTYSIAGGTRDTFAFDNNSDLVNHLIQEWNLTSGDWVNKARETYTYDESRYLQEKQTQAWTGDWTNFTMARYYYTALQGIGDKEMRKFCSFANPMKAGSSVQCPELSPANRYDLSVYSLSGAIIWRKIFTGGEMVNIPSNIASGMYLMRLSENGRPVYSEKIIIVN